MKTGKKVRILLLLSSVCIILYVLCWEYGHRNHEKTVTEQLCFAEEFGDLPIDFHIWEADRDDTYYLILPAAFQKEEAEFTVKYDGFFYQIYIDGQRLRNLSIWRENLKEEQHTLLVKDIWGKTHAEKELRVLKAGELPSVMIAVEAKEELYEVTEYDNKEYVEKGELLFFDENGNLVADEQLETFKVRGNLTAELPKKPFALTFSKPVSLCGMEAAYNYNLLANMTDGSQIRNKIMLDWAGEVSDTYEADSAFVEVFLNGEYQGLYLLTETMEMGENRLPYGPEGLLLEMEMAQRIKEDDFSVKTRQGHTFVLHEDTYLSKDQMDAVEAYLNEIESALYSLEGIGASSGKKLSDLIDMDSWTDMWLLREISADHDMGVVSQFAYVKNREDLGLLYAGPAWDFDGTFGNGMVPLFQNPRSLVAGMLNTKGIHSVDQNRWFSAMYENEEFKDLLVSKFREEYSDKIDDLLTYQIDGYVQGISRAALLDSLRWNSEGIWYYFKAPEGFDIPDEGDYRKYDVLDVHVQMVKDFLKAKKGFLEELWIEGADFEIMVEEHYEDGMNHELNNNIYTWVRKE